MEPEPDQPPDPGWTGRLPRISTLPRGGCVLLDLAHQAVEAARRAGADYADARFVSEESESLLVKNQGFLEMKDVQANLTVAK